MDIDEKQGHAERVAAARAAAEQKLAERRAIDEAAKLAKAEAKTTSLNRYRMMVRTIFGMRAEGPERLESIVLWRVLPLTLALVAALYAYGRLSERVQMQGVSLEELKATILATRADAARAAGLNDEIRALREDFHKGELVDQVKALTAEVAELRAEVQAALAK